MKKLTVTFVLHWKLNVVNTIEKGTCIWNQFEGVSDFLQTLVADKIRDIIFIRYAKLL